MVSWDLCCWLLGKAQNPEIKGLGNTLKKHIHVKLSCLPRAKVLSSTVVKGPCSRAGGTEASERCQRVLNGEVMKGFVLGSWDTDLLLCRLELEPSRD